MEKEKLLECAECGNIVENQKDFCPECGSLMLILVDDDDELKELEFWMNNS